jgi:acyl-CoA hydrolase
MTRPRSITLRFLAEPMHVNFGGKVHGGAVMKWIDQAGYTCAAAWTGEYCVTVYVGGIHFARPILVGEIVQLRALVIHTGRTSLHISVDVRASDSKKIEFTRRGHCVIVFVCLDDEGRSLPVPPWKPVADIDLALQKYALRLNDLRKLADAEIEQRLPLLDQYPENETRG